MTDAPELTLGTFESLVGEAFALRASDGEIEATLVEAKASIGGTPGGREAFSLIWEGPLQPVLEQGIYLVEHADLGAPEIFLVPVQGGVGVVRYQAVFA